jgi:hypothetical protein
LVACAEAGVLVPLPAADDPDDFAADEFDELDELHAPSTSAAVAATTRARETNRVL